jgi:hypothetical protein
MPKIFERTTQPDVDLDDDYVDNEDFYAKGDRADSLRFGEDAVFAEEYDKDKWYVTFNRENTSWCFNEVFDAIADGYKEFTPPVKLGWVKGRVGGFWGVKLAGEVAFRTDKKHFEWNGRKYNSTNYKGKDILIPDQRMWGWYEQRRIKVLKIFFPEGGLGEANYRRVAFGTADDKYTDYPEKYGFMARRAIAREESWKDEYEDRLKHLNPLRGTSSGKDRLIGAVTYLLEDQQRMDEINEESGLRAKSAPAILMINRYITDWKSFVGTYLGGSQGLGMDVAGTARARPDHVTDHEIYRMFAGKHRQRILNRTLFADDTLVVLKVGKTKNAWWNKNQIARHFRILKQN